MNATVPYRIAAHRHDPWEVGQVARALRDRRLAWRQAHRRNVEVGAERFPSRLAVEAVVTRLCAALFPQRLGSLRDGEDEDAYVEALLEAALVDLHAQVRLELGYWSAQSAEPFGEHDADAILRHFALNLPSVRELVDSDVEAAFHGDPAARSIDEILICYPCSVAIIHHRLAHCLHGLGAPLVARIISELANARTGIDIHPGARIGPSFFVDHGTGVVVGETAIIGARVRLYQAVTLGARRLKVDEPGTPRTRYARHPIVEDDVVIYAGATLLGRITVGQGSTIGGNVWLTEDVPPGTVVTQSSVRRASGRGAVETLFADE